MKRLLLLLCLATVAVGAHAGIASAGGYDDSACNPKVGPYGYEECYLPSGKVGASYSWKLTTHGGCPPFFFTVADGVFPAGLTLTSQGSSALISGTPQKQGTFRFNIQYKSHTPTCLGDEIDRYFNLTISGVKLTVTTSGLGPATVGTQYSQQLATNSSSAVTWSVTSGSLPAGLSLSPGGAITGTATTAGASSFVVTASGDGQTDTKQLGIAVYDPLKVTPPARYPAEEGRPLKIALTVAGGSGTHTLAASQLPDGLAFDPATGILSGTPTTAGTFVVTVTTTDPTAAASTQLQLKLTVAAHLAIGTTRLKGAVSGHSYRLRLRTLGGVRVFHWRLLRGKLPPGMRFDTRRAMLVGSPKTAGRYRFTVRVRDALNAVSTKSFVLTVR